MLPPGNEIQSMIAVEQVVVLMGTTSGNLFVYDAKDRKFRHQLATLEDSILCLMYFRWRVLIILLTIVWYHLYVQYVQCIYTYYALLL